MAHTMLAKEDVEAAITTLLPTLGSSCSMSKLLGCLAQMSPPVRLQKNVTIPTRVSTFLTSLNVVSGWDGQCIYFVPQSLAATSIVHLGKFR